MFGSKPPDLSVERHERIAGVGVRFDGMARPSHAYLASGWGRLALVFDESALDIDLSAQTYGIA